MANYYGYDLDSFVQTAAGYENADALLEGMSDSITTYSKEALLYQAVAETLDIVPTQEQIDTYSSYTDTYGENYCTMVALMDAVTDALTESAVVSCPHIKRTCAASGLPGRHFCLVCKQFVNCCRTIENPIDKVGCLEYSFSSRTDRVLKMKWQSF